jgi:Ca2+-binding RTX toxin-like protein
MADYAAATGAVTVNLTTGVASGSDAAGDTLTGIEDVTGSANNDSLTGDAADNALYGGGGTDTLTGGAGADSLDGGAGTDLADYSGSAAGVTVNLTTGVGAGGDAAGDTLSGVEYLTGSALDDVLTGNTAANLLTGGDGSDLLDGDAGADSLYGGAGNDTLKGGAGSDILSGGTGIDTADYSASTSGVNVTINGTVSGGDAAGDTLSGFENLIGSALNDTLTGDTANNYLSGGAGRDSLVGGDGDDTLAGGAGIDTLSGGSGMDYIDYSASASGVSINLATGSALYGDAQGDVLSGVDGIIGSAFDDTMVGFDGQGGAPDVYTNIFYGGGGNDVMDGAAANDILYGGADSDTILGGSGEDTLSGGDGTDSLLGGLGNDSIAGDAGNDILSGDAGNDTLVGGDGADVLYGGEGTDSLVGGAGSDTIYAGAGDIVDGAESGDEFDVINLAGQGPYVIVRDPLNPENGVVNFLDEFGNITGTLTFSNIEQIVSCFTPGTLIATDAGLRDVACLRVGHLVMTRDHGLQPIRWVGARRIKPLELLVDPSLRPIMIRQGALGCGVPERDMMLSRQHRMLINGPRAELLFGTDEVLVRAAHLTCLPGVFEVEVASVTYVHIMFDQHEVVLADGAWSESFQPGDRSLNGLDGDQRDELLRIFPELSQMDQTHRYDAARTTLKAHEARVLLSA